jgi:hypothetical protein
MMTLPELASNALADFLGSYLRDKFGALSAIFADLVPGAARLAMECIGNSDALYHNAEHTLLVTLAGHDIMRGRMVHTDVSPSDYAHVIVACLAHDIGYVRGALEGDDDDSFVIDAAGNKVTLPRGSSDASLMPYHVDRSKLYIIQRIPNDYPLDKQRIVSAIEGTRFPPHPGQTYDTEASIVRASDFIGQLGDPNYIRKANALFYEFEEVGMNRQLGYESPADIVERYPHPGRDPLSQQDLERTAVDREPLFQRVPRRAGDHAVRPADLKGDGFRSSRNRPLVYFLGMIFSENRCTLFRIMRECRPAPPALG